MNTDTKENLIEWNKTISDTPSHFTKMKNKPIYFAISKEKTDFIIFYLFGAFITFPVPLFTSSFIRLLAYRDNYSCHLSISCHDSV